MRRTSNKSSAASRETLARLTRPPRMDDFGPLAGRFVYALRLIALHDRVGRDPIPELATRLGSVEVAAKALALGQAVAACWPENVHVACFCSPILSHDEATVASLVDHAACADRRSFEGAVEGLIRPDRVYRLWEPVLALVDAERRAA